MSCRTNCIVIVFNWGQISGNDYYCLACFVIKKLGNLIGRAIMALNPCKVYMAGHSLGAHIGGFACKYVKENGGLVQEMAGKFFSFQLIKYHLL